IPLKSTPEYSHAASVGRGLPEACRRDKVITGNSRAKGFAMLRTRPAKEVVVRLPNAIGTLDEIAKTVAHKGVNILAVSAWVEGEQAVIRLVTDDSVRVLDALRAQKYEARE